MTRMKSYWVLQNVKVTAFAVSKLFRETQQGKITPPPPPDQIRVKDRNFHYNNFLKFCENW